MEQGNDRLRVVRAASLVFSKGLRLEPVQEELLTNVKGGVSGTVQQEFIKLTHDLDIISSTTVKRDDTKGVLAYNPILGKNNRESHPNTIDYFQIQKGVLLK
jgi:hypothetical protein